MKCWECKKEVNQVSIVHYVYMSKYSGESFSTNTRNICKECYPKLKFDSTHHIKVFSPRGRQLAKGK